MKDDNDSVSNLGYVYAPPLIIFIVTAIMLNILIEIKKQKKDRKCCFSLNEVHNITFDPKISVLRDKSITILNEILRFHWQKEKHKLESFLTREVGLIVQEAISHKSPPVTISITDVVLDNLLQVNDIDIEIHNNIVDIEFKIIHNRNSSIYFAIGQKIEYLSDIRLFGKMHLLLVLSTDQDYFVEEMYLSFVDLPKITYDNSFLLGKVLNLNLALVKFMHTTIYNICVDPNEIYIDLRKEDINLIRLMIQTFWLIHPEYGIMYNNYYLKGGK